MENIIREFLEESYEGLDMLEVNLVELEKDPTCREILDAVFRSVHNIKGSSGVLGFTKLDSVSHVGESLLSLLRDGVIKLSAEITTVLLELLDALREILENIDTTGGEGEKEYTQLIQQLTLLQNPSYIAGEKDVTNTIKENIQEKNNKEEQIKEEGSEEKERHQEQEFESEEARLKAKREARRAAKIKAKKAKKAKKEAEARAEAEKGKKKEKQSQEKEESISVRGEEKKFTGEKVQKNEEQSQEEMKAIKEEEQSKKITKEEQDKQIKEEQDKQIKEEQDKQIKEEEKCSLLKKENQEEKNIEASKSKSSGSVRVNVDLLDSLMNLVGELVLVRNQILQFANTTLNDSSFLGASQRLNIITTELQEDVMKTRMQPIENIWSKFPRVVRDIAKATGKKVRVEMEGKETELDRTLIEAIKSPLTHLIRNSVDHGIEKPEVRVKRGKNGYGTLLLSAYHEGGQVNIEITDDGGGLNRAKILNKAIQRSLITHKQATRMGDREIINLIFLPGFSTAEKITNVSGRGVGMDVVKTNIEKIGGTIDVQSKEGINTTFKIKIPLTLAIIPALIVTCGGDRYAIPQISLLELVRLEKQQAAKKIEKLHNAPVYRLRGNLLPLVYMNKELQVESQNEDGCVNIVVLQADDRQFGLVVDHINDTQEIVVKPLGKQVKGLQVFAGATIMGDGTVALIIDVLGIAEKSNVISDIKERHMVDTNDSIDDSSFELQTLLLFQTGGNRKMAIQLSMVARLEEFQRSSIEKAGDYTVIQYRGKIIPLIRISEMLLMDTCDQINETIKVVVYNNNGRSIGLIVENILDIVEEKIRLQKCENRLGVLGSAIIQGCVMDILDLSTLIEKANPPFFESNEIEERVFNG